LCSLIISDSVAVEIFAIGQPCAKIFSKVWCATFFWDTVYIHVLQYWLVIGLHYATECFADVIDLWLSEWMTTLCWTVGDTTVRYG